MMMRSYAKCSLNANQNYSQLELHNCIPVNCLEKEMSNAWEKSKKESTKDKVSNLSEISPSFFFGGGDVIFLSMFPIWFPIVHHYYYWIFHVDAHGKRVKEMNLKNVCYQIILIYITWT